MAHEQSSRNYPECSVSCVPLEFHVGQERGALPLSGAALNRLVCLPNKPWLGIHISSTSPTRSGKQTKGCFQNLNFPISTLRASSAKNHICNHRTHFYIEVAKQKMLSGLMWLLPSATPNDEACNTIRIKSTPTEPYRNNPGFFYVFPVLSCFLSPPPIPTSHG